MTCDDYLAMLETLPVEELMHGEAREHAAVCHDCNRVTRVVAERERNMIMAYGDVVPSAISADVALSAIATARRRRLAFFYKIGLAVAGVAAVGVIGVFRLVPHRNPSFVRERFALRCLSTGRAVRLLRSNVPGVAEARIRAFEPDGILEVAADPVMIHAMRSTLDRYDIQCIEPAMVVPRAPDQSSGQTVIRSGPVRRFNAPR
jgi:hypothetical protein